VITPEGVPNPFVPAEVELRDFPFIPLDCVRFRDSGLVSEASSDEDFAQIGIAVVLWTIAWHQTPAATLPGDERAIAKLVGFGRDLDGWRRLSPGAMRGFVKCSDGRFHHPVIAEKALEAWIGKLTKRLRGGKGNAVRHRYAFDPTALEAQIARADRALKIVRDRGVGADWLDEAGGEPEPEETSGEAGGSDHAEAGEPLFGGMFEGDDPSAILRRSKCDPSAIAQGSQEKRREESLKAEGESRASAREEPDPGRGIVAVVGFEPPALTAGTQAAHARALALASEHAPAVSGVDPEAWGAFLAMLEGSGGLNGPRLLAAGGQLRVHAAAGRDLSAVLRAAVARGYRDLSDSRLISASGAPAASKKRAGIERAMTPRDER